MYHYVYKITVDSEKYDGFYYYGKHSTNNLDDGYLGSGVRIKHLNKKGYILNKEILCYFDTEALCYEFEELLVDEEMLKDPYCLNLRTGGEIYQYSNISKKKMSDKAKQRKSNFNEDTREKAKSKQSSTRKQLWSTDEYRDKMKERNHHTVSCSTPKGEFSSLKEASISHNVSERTMKRWMLDESKTQFKLTNVG